MGTSGNPGWASRGSSEKIANSLLYNELHKCNFLQGERKPLKTEVFRGPLIIIRVPSGPCHFIPDTKKTLVPVLVNHTGVDSLHDLASRFGLVGTGKTEAALPGQRGEFPHIEDNIFRGNTHRDETANSRRVNDPGLSAVFAFKTGNIP
jgi:hypothetical protein